MKRGIAVELLLLTILGVFMGACRSSGGPTAQSPAVAAHTPSGPMTVAQAFTPGGGLFVPAKTALAASQQAGLDILFVDARPPLDYQYAHIPGAINVPYYDAAKYLDQLPKDKWLVTYCEWPHAESQQLADTLIANGYTKVRVINEGLQGWRDAGGKVVEAPPGPSSGATSTP